MKPSIRGDNDNGYLLQPKKRLSPGALEQLKKGFANLLSPVSRVIRVDVVRYILSQEKQKRELLTRYSSPRHNALQLFEFYYRVAQVVVEKFLLIC